MTTARRLLVLCPALALAACVHGASQPASPTSSYPAPSYSYSGEAGPADAAPPPRSRRAASSSAGTSSSTFDEEAAPSRDEAPSSQARRDRPGLGTEWGERRYDPVEHVRFERSSDEPIGLVSLYYNDRAGTDALARYDLDRGARLRSPVPLLQRASVTVSVVGDDGGPLPWFRLGERIYVVGEAGRSYSLLVRNDTRHRVEVVASVDGLDAMDGHAASLGNRGYVLRPWSSYRIEGFRTSDADVAAFRFGSVRDSYAARTGSDREVGVIGVAVFAERDDGDASWPWRDDEIERRRSARPFSDSRYAQPPPETW